MVQSQNNKRIDNHWPPTTKNEINEAILKSIEKAHESVQNKKYPSPMVIGDFNHSDIDGMWILHKPNTQAGRFLICMDDTFLTQCID